MANFGRLQGHGQLVALILVLGGLGLWFIISDYYLHAAPELATSNLAELHGDYIRVYDGERPGNIEDPWLFGDDVLSDPVSGEAVEPAVLDAIVSVTIPYYQLENKCLVIHPDGVCPGYGNTEEAVEPTQESLFWIEEKREGEEDIVVRLFFKDGELQVEGDLSEGARLFFQMVKPYVDDHIARER